MAIGRRRATADDADLLGRIAREAYAKYAARMEKPPAPVSYDYRQVVAEGWTWALVDERNVVGMVTLVPMDGFLLFRNLAVLPAFHGRGLGKLALSFAEEQARELSLPEVRLWTNVYMPENIPFYRAAGYVETHRSKRDGYRFIHFSKRVDVTSVVAVGGN